MAFSVEGLLKDLLKGNPNPLMDLRAQLEMPGFLSVGGPPAPSVVPGAVAGSPAAPPGAGLVGGGVPGAAPPMDGSAMGGPVMSAPPMAGPPPDPMQQFQNAQQVWNQARDNAKYNRLQAMAIGYTQGPAAGIQFREKQRDMATLGALSQQYGPDAAFDIMYRAGAMPPEQAMRYMQFQSQRDQQDRSYGLDQARFGLDVDQAQLAREQFVDESGQRQWERGGFATPADLEGATAAEKARLAGPHEAAKEEHVMRVKSGMESVAAAKASLAAARERMSAAQQIEQLIPDVEGKSGFAGDLKLTWDKAVMGLTGEADTPENRARIGSVGAREQFRTLSMAQALLQRPAGSGPMSDRELEQYKRMVPSLLNTEGGNKRIAEMMRERAALMVQYEQGRLKYMRKMRAEYGYESDDGYDELWDEYLKKAPPSWLAGG